MKHKIYIILLVAAALSACKESGNENQGSQEGNVPQSTSSISVSQGSLALGSGVGSTVSVDVTTDEPWTLEGMSDGVKAWLSADLSSGKGNAKVTFSSLEFNPYDSERIAVLTFCAGDAKAPVLIRQGSDATRTISLSAEKLSFSGPVDEELSVQIVTDKPWTLEDYTDELKQWVTISPTSGEQGGEVKVKVLTINEEEEAREATVAFSIDKVHKADLLLSQANGLSLTIASNKFEFSPAGGETKQLVIQTNATKKEWTIEGIDEAALSWLSFSKTSGLGEATVDITTKGENLDAIRQASFTVKLDDNHTAEFTVSQATALTISVSPTSLSFSSTAAETKSVTVASSTSSVNWTVEGYTDAVKAWLNVATLSGSGAGTVVNISTLGENRTASDRQATLTFRLTADIAATLTVSQPKIPIQKYKIHWVANGTTTNQVVKGGSGSPLTNFPWVKADSMDGADFFDGKDGTSAVANKNYEQTGTWSFKNSENDDWVSLEMGPTAKSSATVVVYYCNHKNYNIRFQRSYIKIPVKEGYRLSHIKMISADAADALTTNKALTLATTTSGTTGVVESIRRVDWNKDTPFDKELTSTTKNTAYYISSFIDRTLTEFEFTYTEVR